MSIVIFSGPTITAAEGSEILDGDYRPPAKQGDIYSATLGNPKVIVIIDGVFENQPAVWHKEILYAMSIGIHVFGCSSMGALRAVELNSFGMVGFGKIFNNFKEGTLEDDDEVALIHAPSELNFKGISEPLVNIRETICLAVKSGIINSKDKDQILEYSKREWYPNRNYKEILKFFKRSNPIEKVNKLYEFIEKNKVNIKKKDAVEMLYFINSNAASLYQTPKSVEYNFEKTGSWLNLVSQVDSSINNNDVDYDELILELKIKGKYFKLKERAITRASTIKKVKESGFIISEDTRKRALIEISRMQNCLSSESIDFKGLSAWMKRQGISIEEFDTLVDKQCSIQWLEDMGVDINQNVVELLKLDNEYEKYLKLVSNRPTIPSGLDCDRVVSDKILWDWFFSKRVKIEVPIDIDTYAVFSGFESSEKLKEIAIKEYQVSQSA